VINSIVFLGRSNVGKSSLINALYKKDLAYVGKTPGKTKLLNFFNIHDDYIAVDVPGYGYAKRSHEDAIRFSNMMDDYFSQIDIIKLVILIVDSRIGLTNDDLDMLDYIQKKHFSCLILANKIDKLSNNQLFNNKNKLFKEYKNIIYVSALKK
jgi:ribosome biogenesis GTP-binding protein YsxC/EngB